MTVGRLICAVSLLAGTVVLSGCSTDFREGGGIKNSLGLTAAPPDEFLVVSKAPLVVPPDMNLRPPRPGADPIGQTDPRAEARASITGTPRSGVAAGTSAGEQAILSRANAQQADPTVREELLREQGIQTKDRTVADQILQAQRLEAETLDARSEAGRLRAELDGRQGQAGSQQGAATGQPSSILLEDILGGSSNTN